jgi:hypothetical protein
MDEAARRVQQAAKDARSGDDLVGNEFPWEEETLDSPLDAETLDEQASTQMGGWDPRRRDAN